MGIYVFISVLIIIACILQIMIVLVQNSKGGGLAANFTSAGQTMGIRKTADFLEKSTWTIAISILVLSLFATAAIPRGGEGERSRLENQIQNAIDPNAIPTLPSA
ncbi:MAG: preprotein translocase subunit SecG, partial [Bacteroidales bacterium]